jgi:hypothetical protein
VAGCGHVSIRKINIYQVYFAYTVIPGEGRSSVTARIFQFPSQPEPNLLDIERRIRASLAGLSADEQMIEHVAERMMAFIKNYTHKTFEPNFSLPMRTLSQEQSKAFLAALDKGIDGIAEQVQDMISKIVIERLFLEIELYEKTTGCMNTSVLGIFPGIFDLLPENYRDRVNYLVNQLKRPNLKPQEKYLLNVLLHSIIEEKSASSEPEGPGSNNPCGEIGN